MKKWLSILLAAAMTLGIMSMSGCGSKEEEPAVTTSTAVAATEETKVEDPYAIYQPDAGKTYEIEWLGGLDPAPLAEDAVVKLFLEEKYNVKLNVWFIDQNKWSELLELRFAAGEVPDIVRVTGRQEMEKYVKQDLLLPLPVELIEKLAPGAYGVLSEYSKDCWLNTTINGVNYGFPRVNTDGNYNYAPVWRIDWLKNVGIDKIPETIEECEAAFYKFRTGDPDQNGKTDTYALSNFGMVPVYGAYGALPGSWVEVDGKLAFGAVLPGMKTALTYLSKWYKDELIDPEFITGENHGGYWALSNDFANGKIGFSSPGAFYHNAPPLYEGDAGGRVWRSFNAAMEEKALEKVVIGKNPAGPDGKHGNEKWGANGDEMICFGEQLEKDPQKLGKILQIVNDISSDWEMFFHTRQGLAIENHSLDEKTGLYFLNPDLTPLDTANRNEGTGNTFISIETPKFVKQLNPLLYKWVDSIPQFNDGGYENLLKIQTESMPKYWGEMEKLREEAYFKIITGEKPVAYFDEFVQTWNNLGGEQITKEANEWWDSRKQ